MTTRSESLAGEAFQPIQCSINLVQTRVTPVLRLALICAATALGGCAGLASNANRGADIHSVRSANELQMKMTTDAVTVVHALDRDHFERGHIPGARNVDYEKMTAPMLPPDKNAPVVFYCAGRGCPVSGWAAQKAVELGYTDVWVYKGGIKDWRASGKRVAVGGEDARSD